MEINKKFPTWLTANIIIEEIIRGNIKPRAKGNYTTVEVSLIGNLERNIMLVPEELRETFLIELGNSEMRAMEEIGFNPSKYYRRPIQQESLAEIVSDINYLIEKYHRNTGNTVDDIIMESMGLGSRRVISCLDIEIDFQS